MARRTETTIPAKPSAASLIAETSRGLSPLTSEQREQVKTVLEHNDASSLKKRVRLSKLHDLLREHYGYASCERVLERQICAEFGRKSWGQR